MMSMSGAMGIRNTLQNMQIETYMNIGSMMTNPQGAGDLSGIPAIAGTAVGLRLLLRFSPKLQKACSNREWTNTYRIY
ncbi:MAG: hypothetical protein U9R27_01205 [Campylobacterota bacterium]|nr:hypothetical protein [Campylobacterota bacterium]